MAAVLAAGTDIDATPTYPAAYTNTNIMSVIATDESDQLANYSNYGLHNTDIAAPGSKILSTVLNGQVSCCKAIPTSHESCCPYAVYPQMLNHVSA